MSLKKSLTLLNKIVEADGSPKGKEEIFPSYETYDFYGWHGAFPFPRFTGDRNYKNGRLKAWNAIYLLSLPGQWYQPEEPLVCYRCRVIRKA